MTNDERILREALEAGPTPGPWMHLFGDRLVYTILEDGCRGMPVVGVDSLGGARSLWTLRHVAACSPDRIARLLDEIERLRGINSALGASKNNLLIDGARLERENERLREALEYVASLRTGGQIEARCRAALEVDDAR
jgi:hypothetical protein